MGAKMVDFFPEYFIILLMILSWNKYLALSSVCETSTAISKYVWGEIESSCYLKKFIISVQ